MMPPLAAVSHKRSVPCSRAFGSAAGTALGAGFSDGRMKWHEQPIGDGLDVVRRLTPKTYCMGSEILTPEREEELERGPRAATLAGVIAQEVQDVVPGAVHGSEPMSVDYQQLFVYAMAAVKELDATVTELKAARSSQALVIQSLLSRVAALEGI